MKKILLLLMPVLLITIASYSQNVQKETLEIPPCMLGFDYEDPNQYVSEQEIIEAIKRHPSLDTQYKFFNCFDIARKNGAPEDLVYELASNITAFYKRKKEVSSSGFDEKAESFSMQTQGILGIFEEGDYIPPRQ